MAQLIGKHDWTAYAGATFDESFVWRGEDGLAIDFNDYTALMEVRSSADDASVALTLSTENGRLAPQVDKSLRLLVTDAFTRDLVPGKYRYDLLVREIASGKVTPILEGAFVVRALVTKGAPA